MKRLFLSILLLFAFVAQTAFSSDELEFNNPMHGRYVGNLNADLLVSDSVFTFTKTEEPFCYALEQSHVRVKGEVKGEGLLSYQQVSEDRTEHRVPGRDIVGHSRLCITAQNQLLTMQHSLKIQDTIDNIYTLVKNDLKLHAPLSAQEQKFLKTGQAVTLELSAESHLLLARTYMRNLLEHVKNNIIYAASAELPGFKIYARPQVEEVHDPEEIEFAIQKDVIILRISNYGLKAKYKVNVGF